MSLKPKVLVVEHRPDLRQLLNETLTRMGGELQCLESSSQAAELVNREKFDSVFLDLDLPEMGGCDLAEKIRWSKSNSRCPIVMIIEHPEPTVLSRCYRAGVNFFLERPVTQQQLETLLNATRGIMAQERRRYQRAPVQVPVQCQWQIQSLPQVVSGESLDVSASGMRLHLGLTPPPGGVIQMQFKLPCDPRPCEVTARLARMSGQEIGVTFVGLTHDQRQRLMEVTDRVLASADISRSSPEGWPKTA